MGTEGSRPPVQVTGADCGWACERAQVCLGSGENMPEQTSPASAAAVLAFPRRAVQRGMEEHAVLFAERVLQPALPPNPTAAQCLWA